MTPAKIKQGHARIVEPFILTAMASLLGGTLWMWVRHRQFLEFFYSPELLALTHVMTLGFPVVDLLLAEEAFPKGPWKQWA